MYIRDAAAVTALLLLIVVAAPMAAARGQPTDAQKDEASPPAADLPSEAMTGATCLPKDARFQVLTDWHAYCVSEPLAKPSPLGIQARQNIQF